MKGRQMTEKKRNIFRQTDDNFLIDKFATFI